MNSQPAPPTSHSSQHSQEFDLNLAPIIDCFTMLITFLLASASFLSIGILDTTTGASSRPATSDSLPEVAVQVELEDGRQISLKLSGKSSQTTQFLPKQDQWDFAGLNQELMRIKSKWPKLDSLVLSAGNDIEYKNIVMAMEQLHTVIPNVLLGGF